GGFPRLGDVADTELGAFSYAAQNLGQGHPGVAMGVFQTSGSNAREITEQVELVMAEAAKEFPEGIEYVIPFNSKDFLDASIDQAVATIIEDFIALFL